MKKILTTIALSGLAGASLANAFDGLSIKGKVGFESEYIMRGKEHSKENVQTKVIGEYVLPVSGAGLSVYAGAFLMSPVTEASNEGILFTGIKTQLDSFIIDAGYTYYGYPNRNKTRDGFGNVGGSINPTNNRAVYTDSNEINIAAAYKGFEEILTPSVSVAYNFNLQQLTTEFAITRSFDLGQFGINGFEINLAAYAGYVDARRYNGDNRQNGVERWYNGYAYVGGTADLAYNISPSAKVGVGIRYAHNNDGTGDDATPLAGDPNGVSRLAGNTSHNLYYGVWAEFRY